MHLIYANYDGLLLITLLSIAITIQTVQSLNVTFACIGAWQDAEVVPGIEAVVRLVNNHLYGSQLQTKMHLMFPPGSWGCDAFADDIVNYSAEYFFRRLPSPADEFVSVVGPTCVNQAMQLAPMMRELNVIYASTTGTDILLSDKVKYPTTVTMSGYNHEVLKVGFRELLRKFGWNRVAMICDDGSTPYQRTICRNFSPPNALGATEVVKINSVGLDETGIEAALQTATVSARVILVLTKARTLRELMVHAQRKNMTSGEYVYFCFTPYLTKDRNISDLRWLFGDSEDEEARRSFQQLFHISFDQERALRSLSADTNAFMRSRAQTYGFPYRPEDAVGATLVVTYEATLMMAQVIHEALLERSPDLRDARRLARRFFNRTFVLPTGLVYMDKNGDRLTDFCVRQIQLDTGVFQPILRFVAAENQYENIRGGPTIRWMDGHTPSGKTCSGYDGRESVCHLRQNVATIYAPVVGVIIVLAFMIETARRTLMRSWALHDSWWIIIEKLEELESPCSTSLAEMNF